MSKPREQKLESLVRWIDQMLDALPSGVDEEADPEDRSPEDMTAFVAGLIRQKIREAGL